ncbi:MAG: PKD domain-containing protein [Chlorobi bacterium]|nr:PKD domain-containing protein [Chlorobiota bacterium]
MKTRRYTYLPWVLILVILLVSQNGCRKDKDEVKPENPPANEFPETTKLISDQKWDENIISVDSSSWTLTFNSSITKDYDLKVGDVLFTSKGQGLLRKITNIKKEDGNLVIQTVQATIVEAWPNGKFSFHKDLTQDLKKAKVTYAAEGVTFHGIGNTRDDCDGCEGFKCTWEKEIADHVTIEGEVELSPTMYLYAVWHGYTPDTVILTVTTTETLQITSTVNIMSLTLKKEILLGKITLPSYPIPGTPIAVTPVISIKLGANLEIKSEVTAGVKQTLSYTTGFKYIKGDISKVIEMEKSLEPIPPTLSNTLDAKAYIKPELNMVIDYVLSPYLNLEMYGELEAELGATPWWTLYAGLKCRGGLKAGIFGFVNVTMLEAGVDIFDYKIPLANADEDINYPPNASFTISPESGGIGTVFHFDASGCTDNEDPPEDLMVRWDWEDDGNWDTEYTTEKQTTHSYSTAGDYTVRLEVKDSGGSTDETTETISIASNHAPVAVINVEPETGAIGTEFEFDPSGSHDDEDPLEALDFRWDWEDDGTWDTDFEPYYVKQTHIYDGPGDYTVRLQARDGQYVTGETTKTLTVLNTHAPVADFFITPGSGTTDTTFTLNASGCYDEEDPVDMLEVRWNWDNDPDWDTDWSTNKIEQHKFSNPGTYTVQLEVRDRDGYTNVVSKNFSVDESSGIVCPGIPTITYGGKIYHTVLIGDQCWLKENLDIGVMILDTTQTDNGVIEKYCYDDDPDYCDLYGGLYLWDEMMQYTEEESTQGICPPGWHIPSDEEWKVLEGTVDSQYGVGDPEWDRTMERGYDAGINLKSKSGWYQNDNGADTKGFSARPGGLTQLYNGKPSYSYVFEWARWWTSTMRDSEVAFARTIRYYADGVYRDATTRSAFGHSVRCVKDD